VRKIKCAYKNCENEPSGAKQFNTIMVRLYLCRKHLQEAYEVDSHNSFDKAIEFMKKLNE